MRTRNLLIGLFLVSLLFAGVVSYYASSSPDGLEKVSQDHGIAANAKNHDLDGSPLAGYGVSGVGNARLSGGLAGVIGVAVVFLAASSLVLVTRRRKSNQATDETVSSSAPRP
ncbi:hypothetical protein GCM10022223_40820 [Kineosporia mesophila]|uniref:PDGLE domain-containing protein n=1 Tax=Kineosporia mesophila TaxID=566012 RepID=A0ABP6ZX37_9ACTN|nr:PDGLE domain-containing protein [Kineosporia mesophila]MCD5348697.1 PDGLE domain-containing protein [Kineosporia mesophila]